MPSLTRPSRVSLSASIKPAWHPPWVSGAMIPFFVISWQSQGIHSRISGVVKRWL